MTLRIAPLIRAWLLAVAMGLRSSAVLGQGAAEPDLNRLALDWARGEFASPVICVIDGKATRGIRRVRIAKGPSHRRPAVARIEFNDLDASEAERCFTELEERVPNITGWVDIRLPGPRRPDTAARDFSATLRRQGGFEFSIVSGQLQLVDVGSEGSSPRVVDFRGGKLRLHRVRPGSDDARLLGEFASTRKLTLELEAKDGAGIRMPLGLAPSQ